MGTNDAGRFARRPRVSAVLALAVTAALGLAACAAEPDAAPATGTDTTTTSSTSDTAASPAPIDLDASAPEPSAEPDAPTEAPESPLETGAIDEPIELSTGLVIELDSVTSTSVEAETPGEVTGSAVVVKLTARNDSRETAALDSAVVTLTAADGEYGIGTTAGPDEPLAGDLAPGESATASYVFMLDQAADRAVTVSVNYSAGEPIAEFTGKTD